MSFGNSVDITMPARERSWQNSVLQCLKYLDNAVYRVVMLCVVITMGLMVSIILAQVFYRYVIGYSIIWSEEAGRHLLIWTTYLGAGLLARQREFMAITVIVQLLPSRLRFLADALADTLSTMLMGLIAFYGFKLVKITMAQQAIVSGIPMGIIYLCMPIGASLYVFHTIIHYIGMLDRREN
jgi:TRAP-type C4-dicarboxylate transport system permease small subunit